MAKARTVADVILGEAVSGSPAKRYADMKAIASVIANRARALGVTPEQVVSNRREFNAYGKSLPAGVGAYRSLAQRALDDVATNGPIHSGTFYATPKAAGNLPKGLKQETATTGHIYYSDPQNRAIGTQLGYRQPRPAETATQAIAGLLSPTSQPATVNERMGLLNAYSPPQEQPQMVSLDTLRQQQPAAQMSQAQQYASYGAGRRPTEMAGLLSQDVARQRMVDALNAQKQQLASAGTLQKTGRLPQQADQAGLLGQDVAYQGLINGLNTQKQQLQAGVNPMEEAAPWKQPGVLTQPTPMADVPQVDYQPTASVAGPAGAGGLLSPQEQQMYDAQRANLASQPYNSKFGMNAGNFAKGALGGVGGGLLGAALLGPVGGLLGAMLGKSAMTGTVNSKVTGYPQAPKSKSQGDGKETDYGRSVRESSRQYDRAVKSGSVGLY